MSHQRGGHIFGWAQRHAVNILQYENICHIMLLFGQNDQLMILSDSSNWETEWKGMTSTIHIIKIKLTNKLFTNLKF